MPLGIRKPKTARHIAVYTVTELREAVPDLLTQDGSDIGFACRSAGFSGRGSYYAALAKKGFSGLPTLIKMLEAVGFRISFKIRVQKVRNHTEKFRLLDPSIRRTVVTMKRRHRRQIASRYDLT